MVKILSMDLSHDSATVGSHSQPRASVIIPAYNAARFIGATIDSVLAQTYRDFEIIVVDDGSTDDTAAVLRPYRDRIKYIYQANQGVTAAQNAGACLAEGHYVIFSGADDLLLPDQLAIQTRVLDERPEVGLVASGYRVIDENGRLIREVKPWVGRPTITLESAVFGGLAPPVAVMLRRSWFEQAGGFDPQLAYCEDSDLWARLALAGCVMVWAPAITSGYRVHSGNMSRAPRVHFEYHHMIADKAFADPRLPEALRAKKAERHAQLDLMEATRLLTGGGDEEARARIERAISRDPSLLADEGQRLAELVVNFQSDVWGDGRLGAFVVEMTRDTAPDFGRTLATVGAKKRFYTAFDERQAAAVRRSWFDVARHDPRWLFNRGGWSIFGQSFIGFK